MGRPESKGQGRGAAAKCQVSDGDILHSGGLKAVEDPACASAWELKGQTFAVVAAGAEGVESMEATEKEVLEVNLELQLDSLQPPEKGRDSGERQTVADENYEVA